MVENIQTPCNTCIDLEDVNKGTKKMANGKVVDVTLITSELLKWKMPSTCHWIMNIIDQAIKQGLPNFWFSPHEKEVNIKVGDMNQVSHYGTIMLSSTMGKLDSTIMEQKISALAEKT